MNGPLEGDLAASSKLHQEDFCRMGEIEVNDTEEDIFEDIDFVVSEDEYESVTSDSQVSSQSDISERSVEVTVDLKAVFLPSTVSKLNTESIPPENARPFMGEVLSRFSSSFLNHSFKLHSILPASFSALGMSSGFLGGERVRIDDETGKERSILSGGAMENEFFVEGTVRSCNQVISVGKG